MCAESCHKKQEKLKQRFALSTFFLLFDQEGQEFIDIIYHKMHHVVVVLLLVMHTILLQLLCVVTWFETRVALLVATTNNRRRLLLVELSYGYPILLGYLLV